MDENGANSYISDTFQNFNELEKEVEAQSQDIQKFIKIHSKYHKPSETFTVLKSLFEIYQHQLGLNQQLREAFLREKRITEETTRYIHIFLRFLEKTTGKSFTSFKEAVEYLKEQDNFLNKSESQLKIANKELKQQIRKLIRETEIIKDRNKRLEEENESLRSMSIASTIKADQEDKVKKLKSENKELKKQLESNSVVIEQLTNSFASSKNRSTELEGTNIELDSQLKMMLKKQREHEKEERQLRNDIDQLNTNNESLKKEVRDQIDENKDLKEQMDKLKSANELMANKVLSMEEENSKLREKNEELKLLTNELSKTKELIEEKTLSNESLLKELEKVKEEYKNLENFLKIIKNENFELKKELHDIKNGHESMESEYNNLKIKHTKSQEIIAELSSQNSEFLTELKNLRILDDENKDIISRLTGEIDNLRDRIGAALGLTRKPDQEKKDATTSPKSGKTNKKRNADLKQSSLTPEPEIHDKGDAQGSEYDKKKSTVMSGKHCASNISDFDDHICSPINRVDPPKKLVNRCDDYRKYESNDPSVMKPIQREIPASRRNNSSTQVDAYNKEAFDNLCLEIDRLNKLLRKEKEDREARSIINIELENLRKENNDLRHNINELQKRTTHEAYISQEKENRDRHIKNIHNKLHLIEDTLRSVVSQVNHRQKVGHSPPYQNDSCCEKLRVKIKNQQQDIRALESENARLQKTIKHVTGGVETVKNIASNVSSTTTSSDASDVRAAFNYIKNELGFDTKLPASKVAKKVIKMVDSESDFQPGYNNPYIGPGRGDIHEQIESLQRDICSLYSEVNQSYT